MTNHYFFQDITRLANALISKWIKTLMTTSSEQLTIQNIVRHLYKLRKLYNFCNRLMRTHTHAWHHCRTRTIRIKDKGAPLGRRRISPAIQACKIQQFLMAQDFRWTAFPFTVTVPLAHARILGRSRYPWCKPWAVSVTSKKSFVQNRER